MDSRCKIHLNEILEYWIDNNGTKIYSQKLYESVKNVLQVLSRYPESGKITENKFVRSKIVKNYFLFYAFDKELLTVVGFCDMRRIPEFISTILE